MIASSSRHPDSSQYCVDYSQHLRLAQALPYRSCAPNCFVDPPALYSPEMHQGAFVSHSPIRSGVFLHQDGSLHLLSWHFKVPQVQAPCFGSACYCSWYDMGKYS